MYTLWIANKNLSSWSLRPWLLLKVLDIPFLEQQASFVDGGSSYEAFRRFSPTGLVPCLLDGDNAIWDSLAICEYIGEDFSHVWPQDKNARAWARSAASEMHSGFAVMRTQCNFNTRLRTSITAIDAPLQRELQRLADVLSEGLSTFGGPWLAGEHFSVVDAFYAPMVLRLQSYGLPMPKGCEAWCEQILQLPALQTWLAEAALEPEISH